MADIRVARADFLWTEPWKVEIELGDADMEISEVFGHIQAGIDSDVTSAPLRLNSEQKEVEN